MATTTAALTITSNDLVGDALSLSTSNTLYKAGTVEGLDQSTGLNHVYLTATTNIDLFGAIIDTPAYEGKSHWVYIANMSEDETEFLTITIGDKVIGKLYGGSGGGDFLWMPWDTAEDTHANNKHADIELLPSVATGMHVEYAMIHEGFQLPTAV
tara:strand:- start:145 stop:609 length:465 start_codon:yes stop_codon:yes gene_type:complete